MASKVGLAERCIFNIISPLIHDQIYTLQHVTPLLQVLLDIKKYVIKGEQVDEVGYIYIVKRHLLKFLITY